MEGPAIGSGVCWGENLSKYIKGEGRQWLFDIPGGKTLEEKLRFPSPGASLHTIHVVYLKIDKLT
jgi:hypothetical protein